MTKTTTTLSAIAGLTLALASVSSQSAIWSTSEIHFQYGDIENPFQGGGSDAETGGTSIATFQHASGWAYGDNFFFFDYLNYGDSDVDEANGGRDNAELYGELYSNFSLNAITGKDLSFAFVKDIGVIAGFNFAAEVDNVYYLPGIRFDLALPGFAFAHLDITAYIQDTASNVGGGVSIREDDSFMVDFNWAYPFKIGNTSWSIEGHVEYIDGVDSDISIPGVGTIAGERESWILAQPQLRLDLGEALFDTAGSLFVGIEYQYWKNKLGDKDTDENVVQALVVCRL